MIENRFSRSSSRNPLKKYGQIGNSSEIFKMECPNSGGNWNPACATYFAMQIPRSSILYSFGGKTRAEKYSDRNIRLKIPKREPTSTEKKFSEEITSKKTEFCRKVLSMQIFFLI